MEAGRFYWMSNFRFFDELVIEPHDTRLGIFDWQCPGEDQVRSAWQLMKSNFRKIFMLAGRLLNHGEDLIPFDGLLERLIGFRIGP